MERKSWPLVLFFLHSSEGHSTIGVNCLVVIGWKISQPHLSQEYALTWTDGLISDTLVTIPRTVIRWPRCSPRTFRTANAFELLSLLEPEGVIGLKFSVYRRVRAGGKMDSGGGAAASSAD